MLKCRDVTAMASDYLDHNLTARDRWRIRLHLLICIQCRRFFDQLRRVIAALRGRRVQDSAPSEALIERCEHDILARLDDRGPDA